MHSKSDVVQFSEEHGDKVEILDNGKLRFKATGMDFPANSNRTVLNNYLNGRAMRRTTAKDYDFNKHKPFLVPHLERDSKHFLYCTLTEKTVARLPEKVEQHISGKRYKRLREQALKGIEERKTRRKEAKKFKVENQQLNAKNNKKNQAGDPNGDTQLNGKSAEDEDKDEDEDMEDAEEEDDDNDVHIDADATLDQLLSDSSEDGHQDDDEDEDENENDDDDGMHDVENDDADEGGNGDNGGEVVDSDSANDDDDDEVVEDPPAPSKELNRRAPKPSTKRQRPANMQNSSSAEKIEAGANQSQVKTSKRTVSSSSKGKPSTKQSSLAPSQSPAPKMSASDKSRPTDASPTTGKRRRVTVALPRKVIRARQKRKAL